jgi:gluconolactonase
MRIRMRFLRKSIIFGAAALAMLLGSTLKPFAAQMTAAEPLPSPVATGEQPVRLAAGMLFTEGCTSDGDGNVFFVDQNNNRILKYSFDNTSKDLAKGKLEVFLQPSNYANGMTFDNDGNLIACADEKNELWLIRAPFPPLPATAAVPNQLEPAPLSTEPAPKPEGLKPSDLKIDVLIKDFQGKPLNGPNDVFVVPKGPLAGGMYLTDPLYPRKWWTDRPGGAGMQQPGRYVYFLSPDHKTLTPVITDFMMPNGIIGTPDGKTLYVSDINGRKTWSYAINDDGTLKDKTLFCDAGSDGMTIDDEGYIYITSGGLKIFDKNGQQVAQFRMPAANVCFAGKDKSILFICAGKEIYALKMRTHGVGPQ